MKKLVLIGAVALVVLGCVIAAGCTSTEQTENVDGLTILRSPAEPLAGI